MTGDLELGASTRRAPTSACPVHPGSPIRRYRTRGPQGPGVYRQCMPANGDPAHLLGWDEEPVRVAQPAGASLTPVEHDVLADAASGLTMVESATLREKGIETVKTQRKNILIKLGARNMAHAVSIGLRDGLIAGRRGL
jgi:DNA-binding CsgD family transcriptional regulator